ncbi:hypothetical protein [Sphingomonas arenae]|uniref:hypothetical protein n=1 Tax=Sphingomonas arenae TaxID=2812555 RepID=UPI001968459B|nr:hypothetical protein [Sphingomonas arenae]
MLTALVTLPFLLALALSAGVLAQLLREDGDKMLAALKGESLMARPVLTTRPVTVRLSPRPQRVAVRPSAPQWRAAA